MPPRTKISKEMVLDAAFQLVREQGPDALSARAVAERLGCSTQPVMYNYASIEELRAEVYRRADELHTRFILPQQECSENPLLQLGLNYIRFAAEERNLFRLLFQSNQFGGATIEDLMDDPALTPMLQLAGDESGCTAEQARDAFVTLFITAHGMASLLANNAMEYDEGACASLLTRVFAGLMRGGSPC